ncbi:hypothetical protein PJ985_20860 [Streptomyces sp. ACA25]|uniref:hypothetical protein n=1 Tax=Streptomyces sp. ACA25 TaxID=3022596 RepID=UPI0023072C4C|nr:hypothetical protein [Streptomyces sp. ACA25]MDB1090014.1 hypothetical protein [Streptomyces sp. ACA25]
MQKHYYRLLYWKRRLTRHLPRLSRRRGGLPEGVPRALLIFTLVVLLVMVVSAVLSTLPPFLGGGSGIPLTPG